MGMLVRVEVGRLNSSCDGGLRRPIIFVPHSTCVYIIPVPEFGFLSVF